MGKQQDKNHQATRDSSALQGGKSLTHGGSQKQNSTCGKKAVYHGASGITGALLRMIALNTPYESEYDSRRRPEKNPFFQGSKLFETKPLRNEE